MKKVRYYSSVGVTYALTLLFAIVIIYPDLYVHKPTTILARSLQLPYVPNVKAADNLISGRPVRIVIPSSGIDLPIDEGYYNSTSSSWTLSGYHAQYAMISALANNVSGDTFIYGHNNDYVFGSLRHVTPSLGAEALLYTNNGHIFVYGFQSSYSLAPNDTSTLAYSGPSIMTIQTCTGSVNEWRTMYRFNFIKVIQ
jgi:hypothetical protein